VYSLGRIGVHNVVLACLSAGIMGTTSTTQVANQMLLTFTSLRFGLMVGIGGGVPSKKHDIRLGDVVVSMPIGTLGGMIQYDFGRAVLEGQFQLKGSLNRPPPVLLTALANLQSNHATESNEITKYLTDMRNRYPGMGTQFAYPGVQHDLLYEAKYNHVSGQETCSQCDASRLVHREPRPSEAPVIHYGLIASGNQVVRDGTTRDQLSGELDVLCFEMEAAGLMDCFPCLVIRGICDYADSHKNRRWQAYAAATATAYAKDLLYIIPDNQVARAPTMLDVIGVNESRSASDDRNLVQPLSDYAMPKFQEFQLKGRIEDLEEAIRNGRKEVETIQSAGKDHPDLAGRLNNMSIMLGSRFYRTGKFEDLEEAIDWAKQAIAVTPTDHPALAERLNTLANQLLRRFERSAGLDDLEEAIHLARQSVEMTPHDHPDMAGKLSSLSIILKSRYDRTGRIEDLEEAIHLARRSVEMTPHDHPDMAGKLSSLSIILKSQHDRTGRMEDLEEAINKAEQAVDAIPEGHPARAVALSSLYSIRLSEQPGKEHDALFTHSTTSDRDSEYDSASRRPSSATSFSAAITPASSNEFVQDLIQFLAGDEDIRAAALEALQRSDRPTIEQMFNRLLVADSANHKVV
jgi:nucleoside phosphorylase